MTVAHRLPRWAGAPWTPKKARTWVRRGLAFRLPRLCSASPARGSQAPSWTPVSNWSTGDSALPAIESSLAPSDPPVPSKDLQWAESIAEIRGASEALENRLRGLTWLLPRHTTDSVARSLHKSFASSLRSGDPQLWVPRTSERSFTIGCMILPVPGCAFQRP